MIIQLDWSEFKNILDNNYISFLYEDDQNSYSVYIQHQGMIVKCYLAKDGGADVVDFETNYKALGNKELVLEPAPFAAKKLKDGKKLFARNHGKTQTLTAGTNTIDFSIPYPQVKFNELELIGGELGDKVSLKILDDASGTYTTVPNYQLNQFGFGVYVSKDYYNRASNYDADLFSGMRVVIEYDSISAKDIYINYILHEVK